MEYIKEYIPIDEGNLHIVFAITEDNQLKLMHFSKAVYDENQVCIVGRDCKQEDSTAQRRANYLKEAFQLVQVNFSGYDKPYENQGNKHIATAPGYLYTYDGMEDGRNAIGRYLVIHQKDEQVTHSKVDTYWQFYDGCDIVRMKNVVTNIGSSQQTLEYISSFAYTGIEKEGSFYPDDKMSLVVPYNGWQREMSLQEYDFTQIGFAHTQPGVYQRTSVVYEVTNTGHWSTKKYLPLGYIANSQAHTSLFFQIEHNGSWHYEIGDQNTHFYVCVSGPTEVQSHWFKDLKPGESFTSVPVAVGVASDSFEEAMGKLTMYRRRIRRPNKDNELLPVIFNDYMNCLFGDPTTEKELPLIDAAAKCGCEYFVIDAGWYADGFWWDSVGEWQESKKRFPGGVKEVTDYIRKKGMVPGVWLELEVMGIKCKKAQEVPMDWFFVRHGKPVYDRSRFQLDFRNPEVLAHVNEVIDRVVGDYGVGYIKMDYNIEPGIGTELGAESVGQGMLEHEQAYLLWLEDVFLRYPDLVIENCSSGGCRIDYAMLSRYSIQSTSDQEDYRNYATIAMNAPAGVTPEQSAIWSYPMNRQTVEKEEVIYNMVNAMLSRIHQSGHLAQLPAESVELVSEGISVYKEIRSDIKEALPFWPLGFSHNTDKWLCGGLKTGKKAYLAVWKRDMEPKRDNRIDTVGAAFRKNGYDAELMEKCLTELRENENLFHIPIGGLKLDALNGGEEAAIKVKQIYPDTKDCSFSLKNDVFSVIFDKPVMARLFEFYA